MADLARGHWWRLYRRLRTHIVAADGDHRGVASTDTATLDNCSTALDHNDRDCHHDHQHVDHEHDLDEHDFVHYDDD